MQAKSTSQTILLSFETVRRTYLQHPRLTEAVDIKLYIYYSFVTFPFQYFNMNHFTF